jgi:hypothetical protein
MKRQLRLVSPHMRDNDKQGKQLVAGKDVTYAQHLLRDNPYGDFLKNVAFKTGEWDPESNNGTKRAKYWLGYADKWVAKGEFGDMIELYLLGRKQLPLLYRRRRALRLKKAAQTPLREKFASEMGKHLGTTENPPYSNRTIFSIWYGIIGAWCAMILSYVGVKVGSKSFKRGSRWAYVPFLLHDATYGMYGLSTTKEPKRGHIATFDWDDDGVADHTGIFLEWIDRTRGKFLCREGNTSVGNDSDGGQVMDRERYLNQMTHPFFIKYS